MRTHPSRRWLARVRTLALVVAMPGSLPAQVPAPAVASLGAPGTFDFNPTTPEVVLSTDGQLVAGVNGPPQQFFDGLFQFRNVTIGPGVTVRGVGSHPMIWVVDNFTLDGTLSVTGGWGGRFSTNGTTPPGGVGGPAAGRGGDTHPQIAFAGTAGNGPGNTPGTGGGGGFLLGQSLGPGSGGGGGAFGTIGDPFYKVLAGPGTSFVQQLGIGGFGGTGPSGAATRTLPGGGPGGWLFVDGEPDNDFFGFGFDVNAQRFVRGELPFLVGGSGGGAGGDASVIGPFATLGQDLRGGAGGGGGGCLVIVATNDITIGNTGGIQADGGNGAAGELALPSLAPSAGGGGGGSGGLVILAAHHLLVINVKGETYANNDFRFAVSADGGACQMTQPKYPNTASAIPATYGASYDVLPAGGFGGLGIIELVTRPGTNNADGTNTVLDDNIQLLQNGQPLTGATKQRFLAWRGWRNAQGIPVDDFGAPTNIGSNEGDLRPCPVLLPWL